MLHDALGFGWRPPLPDIRDRSVLGTRPLRATRFFADVAPPSLVDLRPGGSPIEDQGRIGSCVAHAVISVAEFMQRRAHGRHLDGSRLFVYKEARAIDGSWGDSGTYLRTGMAVLKMLGVPPESLWPYDLARWDETAPPEVYDAAERFQALEYVRLDLPDTLDLVMAIRRAVATSLPVAFGFTVYDSFRDSGIIPFPSRRSIVRGGHAVYAIGYDDLMVIPGPAVDDPHTTGAVLFANSWGTSWGWEGGYGWLPYRYFTERQAEDCWCLVSQEWVDTGAFA